MQTCINQGSISQTSLHLENLFRDKESFYHEMVTLTFEIWAAAHFRGCVLRRLHLWAACIIKDVLFKKSNCDKTDCYSLWGVKYCNFFLCNLSITFLKWDYLNYICDRQIQCSLRNEMQQWSGDFIRKDKDAQYISNIPIFKIFYMFL